MGQKKRNLKMHNRLVLLALSLVAVGILVSATPRRAYAGYTSHAPIYIDSDNQFTLANGVTSGSGTQSDPYIIENWVITGNNQIYIYHTTAYFIIRNCLVENGAGTAGIFIYGAANGLVANNTIRNAGQEGISLLTFPGSMYQCTNNTVENNIVTGSNDAGIDMAYSNYNVIRGNTSYNNYAEGITVWHSTHDNIINNITDNSEVNPGISMMVDNSCIVSGNTSNNNYLSGIWVENSDNNTLSNNTCENNDYGIELRVSDSNLVTSNLVENNIYGIMLYNSDNNLIFHNTIINSIFQAYDLNYNYWDNGYPSGGNYWSDWQPPTHPDTNNDGVVDNVYAITGGSSFDHYPLVIGWIPYTVHAPISINGNSQFDNAHGVTSGSGTSGNPYIIENWIITPSSSGVGVFIMNTTKYFILRNIVADNGSGSSMGILIDNVCNGQVINCDTSNDFWGMEIALSHDMVIANNLAHNATGDFGFDIDAYSYNILFENNVAYGEDAEGLVVSGGAHDDNIIGNIIENNIYNPGIRIDYVTNILFSNNTIFWNGWESMRLDNVYKCTFVNNNMDSFTVQTHSSYNKFENDNISGYVGFVSGSFCNIIENCSVHYIEESGAGGMGDNNLFFNNYITESGGLCSTSNSTTKWDNNYRGNYWSLWQPGSGGRTDNDNNGIVDTPRVVVGGGNTKDNYPLVIGGVLTGTFIPNQPDTLKLDNQSSPARAKSLHPTFSFRYTDNGGENMTAFQIQVGPDNLVGDTIDGRWSYEENRTAINGGTVSIQYGDNSVNGINVNGPISLTRGTWYYWRVRTTDNIMGTSTPFTGDWSSFSGYLVGSNEWAAQAFYTNQLPTCSISVDNNTHHPNENFHFYSNAHDNDNDNLTYHWAFGDNITSTQTNPVHAYSSVGNYNVTLYVSDPYEISVTDNLTVHVTSLSTNHAPTCTITYPATGYSTTTGTSITFTCTASDPDNDALTYLWDFGDGATSTSTTPTHTYSSAGSRGVSLTVSDGSLTGSDRITIDITAPSGGGGGGGTPPVATAQPKTNSSWGIPLWIILAIAAAISYWRKIRIGTCQLAYLLIGLLVVLYIFAPSIANYQVITFTGTPPWGA